MAPAIASESQTNKVKKVNKVNKAYVAHEANVIFLPA